MLEALGKDERRQWARHGWLVLPGVLQPDLVERVAHWVDELAGWAAGDGPGLHHFEQTDRGPALARSERFIEHHEGLASFISDDIGAVVEAVTGEPAVLFKEKVNYKQPGGGGFAPHQDAAAYRFVERHTSVMVPLDPSTERSGCLWFAPNPTGGLLATDERGRIAEDVAQQLRWAPVEVQPGDLVVFDSHAPHRSGTNTSDRSRRAMYLTYNASAAGDFRDAYYADKEAEFAAADGTFGGERVRISISDDFLGRPVESSGPFHPGESDPVDRLAELYDSPQAHTLYDENVTELEHALQAASLAEADGAPDHLVVAALLHDVGHLLLGDLQSADEPLAADAGHEAAGARWLRSSFGPEVTAPVALHVAAKRYLCATDVDYAAGLSPASVRSLEVQGGPMNRREMAAFAANPGHTHALAVRRWDDLAKVPGVESPPFAAFEPLLRRLAGVGEPRA